MVLDRKLIQAAFLCSALSTPALAHGAAISAEEAFLTRISTEFVPRMQRKYMDRAICRIVCAIDIAAFRASLLLAESLEQWYVEGISDGVPKVTVDLLERWELSLSMPYYLDVTEIPDCAHRSLLLPTCH